MTAHGTGRLAPLTFQQEWALRHWLQEADPYVVTFAVYLKGALDTEVLGRCVCAVVQRHESLRTRIIDIDGHLMQAIDPPPSELRLQVIECTGVSPAQVEHNAREIVGQFFARKVDLATGPLFDVRLLHLSSGLHVLAATISHLLCDGISATLLRRELWKTYGELIQSRPTSLSKPPMQYADYATWQQRQRANWPQLHSDYWRATLDGAQPVRLPVDDGLDAVEPFSPATVEVALDSRVSSMLQALALREGTTVAVVVLSLYATLIASWSGQSDFVIPFVVSGRTSSTHAGMVGQLSQYLPVRVRLTSEESFVAILQRTAREYCSAQRYLDFGKASGDSPEFFHGTSLNWGAGDFAVSTPREWRTRTDCPTIEPFAVRAWPPAGFRLPCDTLCYLQSTAAGIDGSIAYRADRFRPDTMRRFCEALQRVATGIACHPESSLASLRERAGGGAPCEG